MTLQQVGLRLLGVLQIDKFLTRVGERGQERGWQREGDGSEGAHTGGARERPGPHMGV